MLEGIVGTDLKQVGALTKSPVSKRKHSAQDMLTVSDSAARQAVYRYAQYRDHVRGIFITRVS